ncbi:MAG: hypothetical protein K2X32_05075 [Phycisphaerales bacterium]|nr:hypothetical protein [Phycisphaerales bacterium]
MASSNQDTIRSYIGDLIAVLDHVAQAVGRHRDNADLRKIDHADVLIDDLHAALIRHRTDFESHLKAIGGATGGGVVKDILTTLTGAMAGVYGTMRGEAMSRIIRDDYTAMSFVIACATMLHTTALALNDVTTADITRRHLRECPRLIMALSHVLPMAVLADLHADNIAVNNDQSAGQAPQDLSEAWNAASATHAA